MQHRLLFAVILAVLLGPLVGAYCDTDAARREAQVLCSQTNASTVPAPDSGTALLNGTPVGTVDCDRLDQYRFHTECGLPATAGPWPLAAAGVGLLLILPGLLTRRAYRRRQDIAYPLAFLLSAILPATGTALALNGAAQYPLFLVPMLLTAFGIPVAAGMMAVKRSGQRRRTAIITLSSIVLSMTVGVLGTLQYTTVV